MSNTSRQNFTQPVDEFTGLSFVDDAFKNPVQASFMRGLLGAIRAALSSSVRSDRATPAILLSAKDGSVWRLNVSPTGALSTERVNRG